MTAPAVEAPSVWSDFLEIFIAPSDVFRRREEDPRFGLAFLVLVVAFFAVWFVTRSAYEPLMDAEMQRSMAKVLADNPQLKPEQVEGMRGMGRKFAAVGILGMAVIGPLFTGVVLWFAGKLVNAKTDIGAATMVAVYSYFPRVLGMLVSGLVAFLLPDNRQDSVMRASIGPAALMNPDTTSPLLRAFAARLDLFYLWQVVLLVIGLSILGKVNRKSALIAALVVWLLGGSLQFLGALRQ